MRERDLELRFLREAERRGWRCLKFTPAGSAGYPDRILLRDGRVAFLELKAPRGRPTALQSRRIGELRSMGFAADWADSEAGFEGFLDGLGEKAEKKTLSQKHL